MPRFISLLILCMLMFQVAYSQEYIRLESGETVVGQVVEFGENGYVLIQASNGEIIAIPSRKVVMISSKKKEIEIEKRKELEIIPKYKPTNLIISGAGLYSASSGNQFDGPNMSGGFSTIVGHTFDPRFMLGLEMAIYSYDYENKIDLFSVGLDIRGSLTDKKFRPMYAISSGLGFGLRNNSIIDVDGGMFIHPAIGLMMSTYNPISFSADIGYRFQSASFTVLNFGGERMGEAEYKKLVLRFSAYF